MTQATRIHIFGEVLFDCFPGGERILGGAPFNVAWHLQALGDRPRLLSAVGDDPLGREILQAMATWGMDTAGVQIDRRHPTGQVQVRIVEQEPHYQILPDCAYDFIAGAALPPVAGGILYHGSLALRGEVTRSALGQLTGHPRVSVFLDVNLRPPWWRREEVFHWLRQARWAKLNQEELQLLGFCTGDLRQDATQLLQQTGLEQVILTRGAQGALVCTATGEYHSAAPQPPAQFVDTVGAGDGFTAVYLHGLLAGWSIPRMLALGQHFADKVIGLRGATTTELDFYREFIEG